MGRGKKKKKKSYWFFNDNKGTGVRKYYSYKSKVEEVNKIGFDIFGAKYYCIGDEVGEVNTE